MTDNHNYGKPEPGMSDWHVPINENFEQLDRDVEIRDTEANKGNYEPKNGAKYEAIDSGAVYYANGESWILSDRKISSIQAKKINNEGYVAQYPGEDLGSKVRNTIDALPNGQKTVRITPTEDGSPWVWETDLIETKHSLEIIVGDNVEIEYTGDGWPITFDAETDSKRRLRLIGGRWRATGNPSGWVRLKDAGNGFISPHKVNFNNNGEDATAISIENHSGYSELNVIEGRYDCDMGIDFVPASITGGSGTESFQGTTIRDVTINVEGNRSDGDNFAIRPRGNFRYAEFRRPNLFCKEEDAVGIVFDAPRMGGCTITAYQVESVSGSNHTAFAEGPNYDDYYGPLLVGGSVYLDGQVWRGTQSSPVRFGTDDKGASIKKNRDGRGGGPHSLTMGETGNVSVDGDLSVAGDLFKNGSAVIRLRGDSQSVQLPAQNLADLSVGGNEDGEIFHHDGSGSIVADGNSVSRSGYYVWSDTEDEWKSMVQY